MSPVSNVCPIAPVLVRVQGVTNYEPRVLDMLVDFVYSYSKDVLKDAQVIAQAGGRAAGVVTAHEVELAIRQHNFAQPFSMEARAPLPCGPAARAFWPGSA